MTNVKEEKMGENPEKGMGGRREIKIGIAF